MEHPKAIGDRTTLAVMLALTSLGMRISVPFGENCRYDLVVEQDRQLLRVQCKTGRLRRGVVEFRTASSYAHHPNPKPTQRHYRGQIDAFAVYCPDNGGVYVIPIDQVPAGAASLRVTPTLNGQRRGIRQAARFHIATIELVRPPAELSLAT